MKSMSILDRRTTIAVHFLAILTALLKLHYAPQDDSVTRLLQNLVFLLNRTAPS